MLNQGAAQKSLRYTMRMRTPNPYMITSPKFVPGPGHYPLTSAINARGNFVYSKYRNSSATLFNPPSSARFKELRNPFP